MKIHPISFGNKSQIPANHEEMQNKAYAEICRRMMAGETGPFRIDYYHGKEPKIINIADKKQGNFTLIKNIFKKLLKK